MVPEDLEAALAYRGRADVCRFLPFEPMTPSVLMGRLRTDLARTEINHEGQALTLGAKLAAGPEEGRLVGDVVLILRSREHAGGELGYVFHPDVRGQGYAVEACTAVLDLAFGASGGMGLNRVVARIDARNEDSARLAARLGMRREAHFVRNEVFKGEWADELVYAVLADEWEAARARRRQGDAGTA